MILLFLLRELGKGPLPRPVICSPYPATRADSFSVFHNCKESRPSWNLPIIKLHELVRDGFWKEEVEKCRAILHNGGEAAYKASRDSVTAFTISAKVKHRGRGTSLAQKGAIHTGLLQIDLDPGLNRGVPLSTMRATAVECPYVETVFTSLSGEGIKATLRCPASFDSHLGSWLAAEAWFAERGLKIDPATKDPFRLCFVSSDPAASKRAGAVEIIPFEVPAVPQRGERSEGTEEPAHVHRILARLAEKIGPYQNRSTWLHIVGSTVDAVGSDAAGEIVDEHFPPQDGDQSACDVAGGLTGQWLSLRKYFIDPQDHAKDFADCEEPGNYEQESDMKETPSNSPQPFPITRAGDLEGFTEALDFVEGILTEGGFSLVYGPSNCGKTFWTFDVAASVATGARFRSNLEVDQGAVIYVALEGTQGAKNRIEALKQSGKLPPDAPFYLCVISIRLWNSNDHKRLAETIRLAAAESGLPCRLVIIDTLARAMAGGDENSGKDMALVVASIDAIRQLTSAHVLLVHHSGKNEALGARGHSSLRAAVDTEIEISRPEGDTISTVRVTKQRDLPHGPPMPFSLETITLGTNRRGKPITSCVVVHESEHLASKPGRAGRPPTCTPERMLDFLPATDLKDWMDRAGLAKTQFNDHKRKLTARGLIVVEKGGRVRGADPTDGFHDLAEEDRESARDGGSGIPVS